MNSHTNLEITSTREAIESLLKNKETVALKLRFQGGDEDTWSKENLQSLLSHPWIVD